MKPYKQPTQSAYRKGDGYLIIKNRQFTDSKQWCIMSRGVTISRHGTKREAAAAVKRYQAADVRREQT